MLTSQPNDFELIQNLAQRFLEQLKSSGIEKRMNYGSIVFEYKVKNNAIYYIEPEIRFGINAPPDKP